MRPKMKYKTLGGDVFQSTHPLRDATINALEEYCDKLISIHAPLTGCDATKLCNNINYYISIHAPLTGCDSGQLHKVTYYDISIHAPLTGCDSDRGCIKTTRCTISIHAPLTGCDDYRKRGLLIWT